MLLMLTQSLRLGLTDWWKVLRLISRIWIHLGEWRLVVLHRWWLELGWWLTVSTHSRLDLLQAHHLARWRRSLLGCWHGLSIRRFCSGIAPNARLSGDFGNIAGILISLITCSSSLLRCSLSSVIIWWRAIVQIIADLFLSNDIRNLCGLSEEVEVSANPLTRSLNPRTSTESVVIEVIAGLVKLVA